jgi:hypothetical protein
MGSRLIEDEPAHMIFASRLVDIAVMDGMVHWVLAVDRLQTDGSVDHIIVARVVMPLPNAVSGIETSARAVTQGKLVDVSNGQLSMIMDRDGQPH